jgi:2-polyprenyl-6-methoxyphenol hydroxylase-like FAD-dependent oxidoreductase
MLRDSVEHSLRTEVLVVGAGPTGLTAAVRLAQLGVPHVVLDAAASPTPTSKAALVHASTLELLAELDVADALIDAGRVMRQIAVLDRGRPLLRLRLDRLPTRYPFALGVPQSTTEQLLLARHETLGGTVLRRHRIDSVQEAPGAHEGYVVSGTRGAPGGSTPFAVHARYVIGADGSRSTVRSAIGLDFPGQTYPSQFVLADVLLAISPEETRDSASINLSPRGVTVLGLLPSGNHRVIATVDSTVDTDEPPDRALIDAIFRERDVRARCAAEPEWSSRFRIHHRVAERFRVDGVFLAGDAAHVHSPAAGQGMNTGIADAYDCATRIATVVSGGADASLLEGYERDRRPAAQEVLRFTDRMTRMAMLSNPAARLVRRVGAHTVGRLGVVQRRFAWWVTGLRRSPLGTALPALQQDAPLASHGSGDGSARRAHAGSR